VKVDYASGKAPPEYKCATCGRHGVRLWRDHSSVEPILCAACAEAKEARAREPGWVSAYRNRTGGDCIGWHLPAVPTLDGGYWGYTSVPRHAATWWNKLPEVSP
jgi:DNA-directed RNA polymerase subunit RPC12/RpoP